MNNEEKILAILTQMQSDISELKDTQSKQGERLDRIDERLDRIDERLDRMDGRLDRMDTRMDRQDARMDRQDARMDTMQETLTRIAITQENIVLPRIQLALEGHSELLRKMDTFATKEQVEELSADIDVIKAAVTHHSEEIGKLKKVQ